MKLSNRVNNLSYSAIRKLGPYADAAKKAGKKVIHMNIGAPDVPTPREFLESIHRLDMETVGYAKAVGIDELREGISSYFTKQGNPYAPEEICVTNGASEALLFALWMTTDVGDQILTTDPYYTNYDSFFVETGTSVNTFSTSIENGFRLPDYGVMEAAVTPETKAILICNPGNPTGALYSEEEIRSVARLAVEKNLFILADEIYREFVYDGRKFFSFSQIEGIEDKLIVLDSISKRFSACGARIGAILSKNEELMAAAFKLATARLAAPLLEQYGTAALYTMENDYLQKVNEEYQQRRDCIYNALSQLPGVTCYKSEGAFYTIAQLPVADTDDFAIWLLENYEEAGTTVMVAPAAGFYKDAERGRQQIRLAFAVNQENIMRGIEILGNGILAYNQIQK